MRLEPLWMPEAIERGRDPNVGARLVQLTSAAMISHNIYCEERYTTGDGRRMAFHRRSGGGGEGGPEELWVCDLPTLQVMRASPVVHGFPSSPLNGDNLFYVRPTKASARVLCRLNLHTLEDEELFDLTKCPPWRWAVASISPDERYFVSNYRVRGEVYGFYRVDLQQGIWEPFHEHEHICNPHPQFEPGQGRDILVQHNRGCRLDEHANIEVLVGDEGATLYVIDRDGGNLRRLPVGTPHTPPVTGHECWVGNTGRVLLTAAGGEIHLVTPGAAKSRRLWRGRPFNHIAASNDGRYFIADDFSTGKLYVGSLVTNRLLPLCDSGATCSYPQHTHTHAYMTPDNRWVIFNSDRTGLAHVWAAEVPAEFLEALDDPMPPTEDVS